MSCLHVSSNNPWAKVLCITDKISGISYLVDTGAGLSVLPPLEINKPHKGKGKNLRAANGSEIATYGERAVEINFGLGRTYNWVFHVADITTPILGVNFLAACNFNINVHNATVTDKYTNVSTRANSTIINNCNYILSVLTHNSYLQLLNEFPALLSDKPIHPPKQNVVHGIRTTRGPVYCRPRRLSPHISASIKPAFAKLLADGIISVSCSPWCCPLHCVPKKNDSSHPTGDYRPLNTLTVPDTYLLPHLQSFTDQLNGKTVFSKIDLKDTFLQIPVHHDDVPKTTLTTPFGAFQYHYMPFGLSGASVLPAFH